MVVEVAQAYGVETARATELAIALEYFHTASLIFDDLPAMDDATERRGARCVHIEFGEANAMLCALALINRAYFLAWQAVSVCDADCRARGLAYLERYLGVAGLLSGQSMDLHFDEIVPDARSTEDVAIGKTVSLIRLTLVLSAILGGASREELVLLDRIAFFWGISYQIVDDLKDISHSAEESGKTGSRDIALNRPNLAVALGAEDAIERLQRMIRIGGQLTARLIARRPAMGFLARLETELSDAADKMMERCVATAGSSV